MNYRNIYTSLVTKAKSENRSKGLDVVYESHHILPRSFGGTGDGRNHKHPNIVLLTPREHYVAHLLLTAIYPDSPAMHKALWNMCNVNPTGCRYKVGSRMYNHIRSEYIKASSGDKNHFYGRRHSEESKRKIGLASIGRKANLGNKLSEQHKDHLRKLRTGTTLSDETKQKISVAIGGGNHYKAQPVICLKTGQLFGSGKELSQTTGIPFSTVRRWLNGTTPPPISFHYRRL